MIGKDVILLETLNANNAINATNQFEGFTSICVGHLHCLHLFRRSINSSLLNPA